MADAPTEEQRRAIESRELDILLEAGAGTGKTRTTVKRYTSLLEEGVSPSRILVFTFTEKAANELRERVRNEFSDTDSFSMSTAWIGTFHSICASILRAHPIEADIDPSFTILDDIQTSLLKADSYERALSRFMDSADRESMIARFYPPHLRTGIFNAFEQLRSRGQVRPVLPVPRASDPRELILEVIDLCAEAGTSGAQKKTVEMVDRFAAFLKNTPPEELTYEGFREASFSSGSTKITELLKAMDRCRGVLAEIAFGEEIRAALAELLELYGDTYSEAKRSSNVLDYEDLQLKALELLTSEETRSVGARYRSQFDEIMVDEFQDTNQLQLDLIESLRGDETRFFTVGDEMQAIYGFRHADVRLFRNRRMKAGIDQLGLTANFRSQPAIIGAVNRIGEGLDARIKQFRGIEDGDDADRLRHKFAPLRAGREDTDGGADQVEILFTEKEGWAELDLGPLSPKMDPDSPDVTATAGSPEAEALLLAHEIRLTLDETGIKPSETAILFKARARMPMYADALRQVGLKPYVIGGSGFWESREGMDLRALLAVVANPLDDESLIAALAGPGCGLSTDALLLLSRSTGTDAPLWPALKAFVTGEPAGNPSAALSDLLPDIDRTRGLAFVEAIDSIRGRAPSLPLGELVEATVTATGYDLANLIRDPEATGLANMKRIASLAAQYESGEGRDLRGFLEWADLSAELDAEDAVATQEEESEVIRLMTIHKSKGLEFDLVCVADLGRGKNSSGETVFWIGPDPDQQQTGAGEEELLFGLKLPEADGSSLNLFDWTRLADGAKRERTDEELRLFHVALTRAKRRLVMSGVVDLEAAEMTEETSLGTNLASALGIRIDSPESIEVPGPELLSGEVPRATRIPVRRNFADADQEALLSGSYEQPANYAGAATGQPPLWRPDTPSFPNVPLSFTALSEFIECPARFFARRILRLKEPENLAPEIPEPGLSTGSAPEDQTVSVRDDGTRFGSAVHELFEICAERRWVAPTEREVANRLDRWRVDQDEGVAVARARDMILGFLDSDLGRRVKAGESEIEVPLLVEVGRVTVRGFADLLLRRDIPPLVLDYKTNRLDGKAPETKMADYELQRDLYALAVHRATGSAEVETAFVFLENPREPVVTILDPAALDAGEGRLAAVIEEIEQGHFFGGAQSSHKPCGDCWACTYLASRIREA